MNKEAVKEIMASLPPDKNLIILYGQITGSCYNKRSNEYYKSSSFYDV